MVGPHGHRASSWCWACCGCHSSIGSARSSTSTCRSVQAYISPPIAACFVLGILWTRLNGEGAISCLLTGFVLGATRFILEVLDKSVHYEASPVRWLLDMNFLHYAILMFVVCSAVLVGVSLLTPAPDREKLAGLTFATVDDKLDATAVAGREAAPLGIRARAAPERHVQPGAARDRRRSLDPFPVDMQPMPQAPNQHSFTDTAHRASRGGCGADRRTVGPERERAATQRCGRVRAVPRLPG